ncbi:hypothetical protein EGW08_022168, partial [Elysia chlorotica]
VVSAPSGAGKSSLLKKFFSTKFAQDNFTLATSHTTRAPREGEENGVAYHFTTIEEFQKMLDANGFVEYAKVFKNYYGTSKAEIDMLLKHNKNIILEIDWQGAQQTRKIYNDKVKSIFILPPSLAELRNRLESRATDAMEVIDHRMHEAESEISHANEYDYQLINDDFDKASEELMNY